MKRKKIIPFSLLMFIVLLPVVLQADKICSFSLKNCPEDFNDKTIYVPEYVTSISPDFRVCIPVTVIENGTSTPPSIVFIIDHSNSMMGTSGYDRDGSRFLGTSSLLEHFTANFRREVGLVVFYDKLYFNSDDDSMFQKFLMDSPPHRN